MFIGPAFIDIAALNRFFEQHPAAIVTQLVAIGGWLAIFYLLFFAGSYFWVIYKEDRYAAKWRWALLAIDVPQENIQTPKAVEQLFAHLAGALSKPNIAKKYWHGIKQEYFSFEIASIAGYTQFLVRTEENYRDLVEAAIYAQYPDAEIVEVEDYTDDEPSMFPNDTHDMWGGDFTLTENAAYPIRTYQHFEHTISKDTILKDPMSAFLESFSRLGPGEEMWFQILIQPTDNSWKEKHIKTIKEIIGDESVKKAESNIIDTMLNVPLKAVEKMGDAIFEWGEIAPEKEKKPDAPNKMLYLTPGERKIVESMEEKISKIGFKTKLRGIYVARREVFKVQRGVSALIGAINQFNNPRANSIAPTFSVSTSYFGKKRRTEYRKRLLMKAYKKRKMNTGANPFILNIEELATFWHFPMAHVKTPLLQKTAAKHAEPPATLPTEVIAPPEQDTPKEEKKPVRFG